MRIDDKIEEIELYLTQLSEITPSSLEEYISDFKQKLMCERLFEKIIEAVVDLAFLVIGERRLKSPEDDKEAFDVLIQEGIIPEELGKKLKDAKGMRNIIAHKYGKIDDEIVFEVISEELDKDVRKFINNIKK